MPKEKKTKEKKTKEKKIKDKKSKVKTYNFLIKNPSPLSRRQAALRHIISMTNSRRFVTPDLLAIYLDVSQDEADTVIRELANAGYIQTKLDILTWENGELFGSTVYLTITPGKDVTAFLNGEEEQQVKKEPTGESTSKVADETPQQADP